MNKNYLFLSFLIISISCKSGYNRQKHSNRYPDDWAKEVYLTIDKELTKIPQGCPPLKDRIGQFKEIIGSYDLERNHEILDSLIRKTLFDKKENELVIIDRFIQAFNFSHCTIFFIRNKKNNLLSGFERCKRSPDPGLIEKEPFLLEKTDYNDISELNYYLKLKSNCNLDGIFIITIIDPQFNITKMQVALMPT